MNSNSILDREKEFIKLNQQLNLKCDRLVQTSPNSSDRGNHNNKCNKKSTLNNSKTIKSKQSITTNNEYKSDHPTTTNNKVSTTIINNDLIGDNNNICSSVINQCSGNHYLKVDYVNNLNHDVKSINAIDKNYTNLENENGVEKLLNKNYINASQLILHSNDTNKLNSTINGMQPITRNAKLKINTVKVSENSINAIPDKLLRKNISSDGLLKFLKAKIIGLQQELESSQIDNGKKSEEILSCIEANKKLTLVKDQILTKNNSYKLQLTKFEEKNTELELTLKEKDIQIQAINRQCEAMKREFKSIKLTNNNLESRLSRTIEDLEQTKQNYNVAKDNERGIRESSVNERKYHEEQIKLLRRQRTELITAYKKQLLLVDNLKRQTTCLEQSKLIEFAEKDFSKILELDWDHFEK